MLKTHYTDVINATFAIDPEDETGKDFSDGIIFALDKLAEIQESVVRCEICACRKVCFMKEVLGDNGFCSQGIRDINA